MKVGLIVGTGMDSVAAVRDWREENTPYGAAYIGEAELNGIPLVLLRRHGKKLNIPPHLINYRANIWALRELGVTHIMSTVAVGSLRADIAPGSVAAVDDFIDFTKHRIGTFFDTPGETVVHTDFTNPYSEVISAALEEAASAVGFPVSPRVTYLCVDGPRYESPAEVHMFARWGGDVVGMTGVPEVVLAGELGIEYGSLAIVSNYAAGIAERPLSHAEVLAAVADEYDRLVELIRRTVTIVSE